MILNKYILPRNEEKNNRGYSITSKVQNEVGDTFFAKWIKGIKKDSRQSKILFDKLRHLKKAVHPNLPKIIEYDWDESEGAYCIIFENIEGEPLEVEGYDLKPSFFFQGIIDIISCLQTLLRNNRLTHGDITPANILVDKAHKFYLIDFGLSDITATLSQEATLEIFAREFAAPEKWDRKTQKGFPYKSDIYSLGKVIEWYLKAKEISEFKEIANLITNSCEINPSDRLEYNQFTNKLSIIRDSTNFDDPNIVFVVGTDEFVDELNDKDFKPKYDVNPKELDNTNILKLDIATSNYYAHCLWIIDEKKLLVRNWDTKDNQKERYDRVKQYGENLSLPFTYKSNIYHSDDLTNLTPILKKIQKEKQQKIEYRDRRKKLLKELGFYKELLNEEKKVIEKNSLRLKYTSFRKQNERDISFKIQKNDKYSGNSLIESHIENSLPPNPKEFEYILSQTADRKQQKKPIRLNGIAYDFDFKSQIIKFKDCNRLNFNEIPNQGFIFENISRKEEEKNRQLEAIRKVEHGDVQNKDLIHYLFNPSALEAIHLGKYEVDTVYQTDKNKVPFEYSFNQHRAIINATERTPLTVIQGPPGTGKTTVITEIVFQILNRNPDAKILITSQTNNAVDNVLENLLEKDIPLIRLSGIRQPKSILKKHTLENKIEGWKIKVRKKAISNWKSEEKLFLDELSTKNPVISSIVDILLSKKKWKIQKQQIEKRLSFFKILDLEDALEAPEKLIDKIELSHYKGIRKFFDKREIHKDWVDSILSLDEKSSINKKLVDSIRVIGATTNHIAAKKYKKFNFEFDYVIMDESGKATIAESLIPIVFADKLVLVGDHRQLRPMLTSNREVENWLRNKYKNEASDLEGWDDYFNRASLFEKVIEDIPDDFKSQLEVCRRSSKDQVKLTSKSFYEPFGDEKIEPFDRPKEQEHNLDLQVNSSIIFLDIGNASKSRTNDTGSSYNRDSAKLIPKLLKGLDSFEIVKDYSIGVISGYSAQIKGINNEIRTLKRSHKFKHLRWQNDKGEDNILVSVVDKFQGLENDIIIFDLVKSNVGSLGFLANPNRVNVALSRQKKLLIIIGNYRWLLDAKSPNGKYKQGESHLQKYLKSLNKEWIVNNTEQIF